MLKYKEDLEMTLDCKNNRTIYYNNLYFSSNEKFNSLFSCFDFEGKDIFSVVGSGNQSLYFYNQGANQVDLYDVNIVSIYYYYLRIWAIKYLKDLYPKIEVDYIKHLILKVNPENRQELNAYKYWVELLRHIECSIDLCNLFFPREERTLDLYIDDVSKLNEIISTKKISYTPIDISKYFRFKNLFLILLII